MSTEPEIHAAAVVYRHDEHDRQALADFARETAGSGCRLGGMMQEFFFDDKGRRTRIDSVDLATGDRVTINQASHTLPDGTGCTLDTAARTKPTSERRPPAVADNTAGTAQMKISENASPDTTSTARTHIRFAGP